MKWLITKSTYHCTTSTEREMTNKLIFDLFLKYLLLIRIKTAR